MNNLEAIFIEMNKLDSLMYIVNKENGSNHSNNKKLLSQLNKIIKLQSTTSDVMTVDCSSGIIIDQLYLKQQKKHLINQMKLLGQRV